MARALEQLGGLKDEGELIQCLGLLAGDHLSAVVALKGGAEAEGWPLTRKKSDNLR